MATEERVKSYLDMSDASDADYKRCGIEIFLDSLAIPSARSKFDIHKDVPANRIRSNGYVEEHIGDEIDDYLSMIREHIVVRITGEDGEVLDTHYPYGPNHYVNYCKDCTHAEIIESGRLCSIDAGVTKFSAETTPVACALFRSKEEADG